MQIYNTAYPFCYCNQHNAGGKVMFWFDNDKTWGSKINLCKEYIPYAGDLGVKETFSISFKAKIIDRVQLNHTALWFHAWKWVRQSNCSLLQFIFSFISLWWIRISWSRGSLQSLSSQSTYINMTSAPWRPSSLLLKFSASQVLFHPGLKSVYSLVIYWFWSNHNSQQKTFPSLLNAMVSIPHLNYLLTWIVPLEAIGTTRFTKVILTR